MYHTVVRFSGNEVSNAGNGDIIGEPYTFDRDFTVDVQEGGSNPGHCVGFIPSPTPGSGGGGGPPGGPPPTPSPTPNSLSLVIASLDDSEQVLTESAKPVSGDNGSVDLTLGNYSKIYLVDSSGGIKKASYKLNSSPEFNQEFGVVDVKSSLYADRVALLFSEGTISDEQNLVPLHLGNQTLTITPNDSAYSPFNVRLKVNAPLKVGEIHNELDNLIVKFSHSRGVPPQLIKGQIAHESAEKFDSNSFRYEPRTRDLISFKNRIWEKDEYKKFKLGNSLNAQLGDMLYPRRIYKTKMQGLTVNIPDNYETTVNLGKYSPLTAQNLMIYNNAIQNWDNLKVSTIPEIDPGNALSDFIKKNPSYAQFDFVAQTILSSSYGLLQIMYPTAVTSCNFKNLDGSGRRPIELFDPNENVNCGTSYLVQMYIEANKKEGAVGTSKLTDFSSFKEALKIALQRYNGASANLSVNEDSYSSKVWRKTTNFWPIISPEK